MEKPQYFRHTGLLLRGPSTILSWTEWMVREDSFYRGSTRKSFCEDTEDGTLNLLGCTYRTEVKLSLSPVTDSISVNSPLPSRRKLHRTSFRDGQSPKNNTYHRSPASLIGNLSYLRSWCSRPSRDLGFDLHWLLPEPLRPVVFTTLQSPQVHRRVL